MKLANVRKWPLVDLVFILAVFATGAWVGWVSAKTQDRPVYILLKPTEKSFLISTIKDTDERLQRLESHYRPKQGQLPGIGR